MSDTVAARRHFLLGAASLLAAPAIVRVASIMPVKAAPTAAALEMAFLRAWERTQLEMQTYVFRHYTGFCTLSIGPEDVYGRVIAADAAGQRK